MSMQSAMAVLGATQSIPSNIAQDAPRIDSAQQPAPQVSNEAQKSLQEAIKPKIDPINPAPKSDAFAALAKKERSIQKQLAGIKAKEAQFKEWEQLKASANQNPLEALKALGLSYEQITQFLLNGSKPTPELELQSVKSEVERLRQEQVTREQAAEEAKKQAAEREYQETLADFNQEIRSYIVGNKDQYELTNMYEGQEIVQATIEQHFANSKKIMSIKEAADLVEQYFEEQVSNAQKTKKFQAKSQPKEGNGQSKGEGASKSTPTLSNGLTSSAPSLLPAKTEMARMNRALAALDKASS